MKNVKMKTSAYILSVITLTNMFSSVQAQELPIVESQELDVEQIIEKLPNLENNLSIELLIEKEQKAEEKAEKERIEAEEKAEKERAEQERIRKAEERKANLSDEEIAKLVINGDYGNGTDRRNKLESEGKSYEKVQAEVSRLTKTPTQNTNREETSVQISTSSSNSSGSQSSQSQSQNSSSRESQSTQSTQSTESSRPQGRTMTMEATGYSTAQPSLSRYTANGTDLLANPKVVAVDPTVIPLGTKITVEGYGTYIAADTGGAIKGNKIDIHFTTVQQAINFGRRNIKITIH